MHPDLFTSFVDIQGDQAPSAGTRAQTIERLFGGSARAYEAFDPLAVMQMHGPYRGVASWFSPPTGPGTSAVNTRSYERERVAAVRLCGAGQRLAIACAVQPFAGPHTMQSGTLAFAVALPWLASQVGTPEVEKVSLPSPAPLSSS